MGYGPSVGSTRLLVATLATLALGGATGALAGVSETVATDLRLANRPPSFHGKVKTDVPDCESDRRVKLFYLRADKGEPGPGTGGELIGRTNSDRKGKWLIEAPPTRGAYYAKVKQHIVNIEGVLVRCEPDFSRGIVVEKTRRNSGG